jgi:hypothetical protein
MTLALVECDSSDLRPYCLNSKEVHIGIHWVGESLGFRVTREDEIFLASGGDRMLIPRLSRPQPSHCVYWDSLSYYFFGVFS